ncbi:MAG TPA: hypothetical protein VNJ08_09565 [Bacteriovoracaceae bacterium]|nr:hypothetical protein [Bacteriovoracaceae bacterium]
MLLNFKKIIYLFSILTLIKSQASYARVELTSCGIYDFTGRLHIVNSDASDKDPVIKTYTLVLYGGSLSELKIPLHVPENLGKELQALNLNQFKANFRVQTWQKGTSPGASDLLSFKSGNNPGGPDEIKLIQARGCK